MTAARFNPNHVDDAYRNQEIKWAQQILILEVTGKLLQNASKAIDANTIALLNQLMTNAKVATLESNQLLQFLKDTLSSCQSYPEVEKELKQCLELIETMRTRCVELNITPLACAINQNRIDYMHALIQAGANINSIIDGYPLVSYALDKDSIECLKFLMKLNVDVTARDKKGKSVIDRAYAGGIREIIQLVDKTVSEEKIQQWVIQRHFLVNNLSKLFSMFNKDNRNTTLAKEEGGQSRESFNMITPILQKYAMQNSDQKLQQIARHFADGLSYFDKSIADQVKLLENGDTLLFASGFYNHAIGCALYQTAPNQYRLTLAEKGPLSYYYFIVPSLEGCLTEIPPLISITLTGEHLEWVLRSLANLKTGLCSAAKEVLYKTMPAKLGGSWEINHDVLAKVYKAGICFYSNIKALLLSEFVRAYGNEIGYQNYKRFNLFMRQEVLSAYKALPTKNQDYINLIEEDLQIKSIGSRQYHRI